MSTMSPACACASSSSSAPLSFLIPLASAGRNTTTTTTTSTRFFTSKPNKYASNFRPCQGHPYHFHLQVKNNIRSTGGYDGRNNTEEERSDADKIVDGVDFGELCNEFECISSPLVESTARQVAKDILELREGDRPSLSTFTLSVKYTDPVRSFTGRDKYKRPLWATSALENPSVSIEEMVMLSTSELSIKWKMRGKPKLALLGGDILILRVTSKFSLNQISGQVVEHQEFWDLSANFSPVTRAFFWTSRIVFAAIEAAKDLAEDSSTNFNSRFSTPKQNLDNMYPSPSADPTKFFQREDSFERDAYQIAILLALLYLLVQFLRTTL